MSDVMIIEHGYVVTNDGSRAEYAEGHVVVDGNRIAAVGAGPAPDPGPRTSSGSTPRGA